MTVSSFDEITTDKPEKSLTVRLTKTGGRNQQGKLTVRHRGGGHKRLYRIIDFKRTKDGIPARVATIEYGASIAGYAPSRIVPPMSPPPSTNSGWSAIV